MLQLHYENLGDQLSRQLPIRRLMSVEHLGRIGQSQPMNMIRMILDATRPYVQRVGSYLSQKQVSCLEPICLPNVRYSFSS